LHRGVGPVVLLALGLTAAPACASFGAQLPPYGQALFVVDTDVAVPALAARLRVDVYAADGTWIDSRDDPRIEPGSWPLSFNVYTPDEQADHVVVVRLRAYPEGLVRDYHGERYQARPAYDVGTALEIVDDPAPTSGPTLVIDGTDVTPATEPLPTVTIDRLVQVRLQYGQAGAVRVVLRGACDGTMADVANGKTCVETENALVDLVDAPIDPDIAVPTTSLAGTFAPSVPCTATPRPPGTAPDGTPLHDEEVCVPGGAFVFGSRDGFGLGTNSSEPERVAIVPSLRVDRYEVTVARWRAALAAGFVPPADPLVNDGPIQGAELASGACTYTSTPATVAVPREQYPLNCIRWSSARAFCQFTGGDLPTEVQWEWVASASGRPSKTRYPWGGNELAQPSCTQATWGRGSQSYDETCIKEGFGPTPITQTTGDVSVGLGIVGLAGNIGEFTLDAFASLKAVCWRSAPLASPSCSFADPTVPRTLRGGLWFALADNLWTSWRGAVQIVDPVGSFYNGATFSGIRCVRGGT
jgi:formylglycine-generating enzyme required for sulfatase activity